MKVKVKVPFVFTDDISGEDSMRIFDNLPRPMQARVIDSLQRKREQLSAQVDFIEHTVDFLGRRN